MLTTLKKRLSSFSALGPEVSTCWASTLHLNTYFTCTHGARRCPRREESTRSTGAGVTTFWGTQFRPSTRAEVVLSTVTSLQLPKVLCLLSSLF